MKTIKAWATMNKNETNGFDGILWCPLGQDSDKNFIPLAIFSSENEAIKMAERKVYYKVIEIKIIK